MCDFRAAFEQAAVTEVTGRCELKDYIIHGTREHDLCGRRESRGGNLVVNGDFPVCLPVRNFVMMCDFAHGQ
jgi:hypothetical protein